MKKSCLLFLSGRYNKEDLLFYKKLIPRKTTIAVDGGYAFFKKIKTYPDYLIGDMDSLKFPKKLPSSVNVITYPTEKDKTDSQIAVEFCIDNNCKSIEMVMPTVGEVDHFIGNIMLMTNQKLIRWVKAEGMFKIINAEYEISLLINKKVSIRNAKSSRLSIIPISKKIKLTTSGTKYKVTGKTISRGDSISLRNIITSNVAQIEISGEALVYHKFTE